MSKKDVVLAIDIGGTNTVAGVVDREGTILSRFSMPTIGTRPFDDFMKRFLNHWESLTKDSFSDFALIGIGAGAPNANFYNGRIENPPNLKWGVVPFVEEFTRQFQVPVLITNDANAAALGEKLFGVAKGREHFIEVTLGTGLGSGIVSNGQVVYGHDGAAGELGHIIVRPNGRVCGCGNRGCLETYASATGLVRTMLELLSEDNQPSDLREVPPSQMTSRMVYDAAKKGDPLARQAFEITADILGQGLATAVALFSPDLIVLFGGLAKAADLLVKPAREAMNQYCFGPFKNKVDIQVSTLPESDAAILGSAALIWNHLAGN